MNWIKKYARAEIAAVLALTIVLIGLFVVSPSAGVADNGDFERVMRSTGLDFVQDTATDYFYHYVHPVFRMRPIGLWGTGAYATTHVIPVRLARIVNRLIYAKDYFHTLTLAFVYAILLLIGVYLIVKNCKTKNKWVNAGIAAVCVWVFGDATNLVYFNSLYGEACSYVFLLLTLGLGLELIRQNGKRWVIVCFFISALMLFGSKLQYTLLSPLLLFIAIPLARIFGNKRLTAAALGITLLLSIGIYVIAPSQLGKDTMYNSVFYGILKGSKTVAADVEDLGLPAGMAALAGTNAYSDLQEVDIKSAEFDQQFFQNIGRGKVIAFYLMHPARLIEKMELTADMAFDNTIGMMGNFQKQDVETPHQHNTFFTSYNWFKAAAYPNSFWFIVILYLLYFAYLIAATVRDTNQKTRLRRLLLLMILVLGVIQFPLPIIGNGEADIAKQLFVFNATFDIALLAAGYAGIKRWVLKI